MKKGTLLPFTVKQSPLRSLWWRRERDLNPRYKFKLVYSLSRRAPSADSDISPWRMLIKQKSKVRQGSTQTKNRGNRQKKSFFQESGQGSSLPDKKGLSPSAWAGKPSCQFLFYHKIQRLIRTKTKYIFDGNKAKAYLLVFPHYSAKGGHHGRGSRKQRKC